MLAYCCSEHKNIAFTPGMTMFVREAELQYPLGPLVWLHDNQEKRPLSKATTSMGRPLLSNPSPI